MGENRISGESLELNRLLAGQRVEQLHQIWTMHLDQHFQSFRWIIATMLLINSGGAISIFSMESIEPWVRVAAGAIFATGALAAMAHALRTQRVNQSKMKGIQKRVAYWVSVEQAGISPSSIEDQMIKEMDELFEWPISYLLTGWLPVVLFVIALSVLGYAALIGAMQ